MLRLFTGREWRQGLLAGGFVSGGMLLQTDGLAYTEASVSAFLTSVLLRRAPGFCRLRARAWPHWRVLVSTVAVLAGVALCFLAFSRAISDWVVASRNARSARFFSRVKS